MKKGFVAWFHFIGWNHLSLGLHLDVSKPNIELHVPFGFFRVGWSEYYPGRIVYSSGPYRTFGFRA
jgi:hypothetical protein